MLIKDEFQRANLFQEYPLFCVISPPKEETGTVINFISYLPCPYSKNNEPHEYFAIRAISG